MKSTVKLTTSGHLPIFIFIWYVLILWLYPYRFGWYIERVETESIVPLIAHKLTFVMLIGSLAIYLRKQLQFFLRSSGGNGIMERPDSASAETMFYFLTHIKRLLIFTLLLFLLSSYPREGDQILAVYLFTFLYIPLIYIYIGRYICRETGIRPKSKFLGWIGVFSSFGAIILIYREIVNIVEIIKATVFVLVSWLVPSVKPAWKVEDPGGWIAIFLYALVVWYGLLGTASAIRNFKVIVNDIQRMLAHLKKSRGKGDSRRLVR